MADEMEQMRLRCEEVETLNADLLAALVMLMPLGEMHLDDEWKDAFDAAEAVIAMAKEAK